MCFGPVVGYAGFEPNLIFLICSLALFQASALVRKSANFAETEHGCSTFGFGCLATQ
jgi:hypothetical protein